MPVLFFHTRCCLRNKMTRKTIRTITLFALLCCTYTVYKLPNLYWSMKSSQHQSVIATNNLYIRDRLDVDIRKDEDVSTPQEDNKGLIENISTGNLNESLTNISASYDGTLLLLNKSQHNDTSFQLSDSKINNRNKKLHEVSRRQNVADMVNDTVDMFKVTIYPENGTIHSLTESIDAVNISNVTRNDSKAEKGQNVEYGSLLKEIDNGNDIEFKYKTFEEDTLSGDFVFDNEDIEFNINDIDDFQKKSKELFENFPNHQNATKYLIYLCEGKCGGLADRLKGITMVYMMSLLTKRHFAISMETPCEIENFLQPNLLDWTFPDKKILIGKTVQTLDCFEKHSAYEIELQRLDPDPISMLKADVVLMKANQDWTRIFRKLSVSPKRFPQLYQYHSSELLRIIYVGLFKPSTGVSNLVDEFFRKEVGEKKLACLHARMGEAVYQRYTYREIMIPLQFLKRFDNQEDFKIMIATDTENVKTIANHMFKNFVDTSGPILHIDYMRNGSMAKDLKCAGFMRSVVDHVVLQRCDKLVLTGSGFGVTAASIRHTSRGLHVYMRGEAVMPTRRELVRETFQWRCLAPSFDSTKFYSNICDS